MALDCAFRVTAVHAGTFSGFARRGNKGARLYPYPFRYHRAESLREGIRLLSQLGQEAKLIAGGQSLIPLMKLRLSRPAHLIDLNFIPGMSYVQKRDGAIRLGAMTRHSEIEHSELAARIPIVHDCAAGIADAQVRNRGTVGGSLAEADPSGDWAPVLLSLDTQIRCAGPAGERSIAISDFFADAYSTHLQPGEIIREIVIQTPPGRSGGAYIAFKRCAPVYASASAAVQLTMQDHETCQDVGIVLGCVGLTAIRAREAERVLRRRKVDARSIAEAAEAAMTAAEPQADMRGSAEYKRVLVRALVKRALAAALRRSRGERVEVSHEYIGRN